MITVVNVLIIIIIAIQEITPKPNDQVEESRVKPGAFLFLASYAK